MEAFGQAAPLKSVQPPYNLFERAMEKDVLPYAREKGLSVLAYGSICRGLLSGRMRPDTVFAGDDLRRFDSKFKQPRYPDYLKAVAGLNDLAQKRYGRGVLEMALRWVLDKGVIALWGARHPEQLEPLGRVFGWSLAEEDLAEIDRIISRDVKDPVGPEFMAPPARKSA
jgi:aryl-alcohol dehydrogenase-like predicted oxidoreductase